MWLYDRLKEEYPERVVPPIPEKNRMEYLGRFTPDFIKKRQTALRRFLHRIDAHFYLRDSPDFGSFLQSPVVGLLGKNVSGSVETVTLTTKLDDLINSKESNSNDNGNGYLKPVIESLGDVLTATIFSHSPKLVPETFLRHRKDIQTVKSHLSHLERLFNHRIIRNQPAIVEGMKEIAGNFDELSASIDLSLNDSRVISVSGAIAPPFVKSMLSRVSATMTQCAHLLDKSTDDQELNLLSVLWEYSQYCDAALEIISTRDRRQVEVEELTKLVKGFEKEIEEINGVVIANCSVIKKNDVIINPHDSTSHNSSDTSNNSTINNTIISPLSSTTLSSTTGSNGKKITSSFFDYLSHKWDSWKGVDPITARKNRLTKIETRLTETQCALQVSQNLSIRADTTLTQEIEIFLDILRNELGREFRNHCWSQVKFHETNLVYWKDFLAWLDNPPKHIN